MPLAEDMLMDPLILAGEPVVPLVIREVQDRQMPLRIYAIGFLGNGSYRQALPMLETILRDTTEEDEYRCSALRAIYRIDERLGHNRAEEFRDDSGFLGSTAKEILAGEYNLAPRRSYADALAGRHD